MASANGRSPAIEEFLQEHGVTEWEYSPRFALKKIDRRASFHNQARLYGAINDDWVVVLACGMEETPDRVDPIILSRHKGGYKILGGNHRYKAAMDMLEWTTLPAYEITQEITETQERVIAYTDNLRNRALQVSLDERLHHAAWLVENRSMAQRDAAKSMGIPEGRLRAKLARDRTIMRIDKLGLQRNRERIKSSAVLDRLSSIRDDEVLTAATKLVSTAHFKTEDTSRLIARINRESSVAKQLALIDKVAEEIKPDTRETAGGKVPLPRVLTNIKSIISRVERVDLVELRDIKADPQTKQRIRLQTKEASARLAEIAEAI